MHTIKITPNLLYEYQCTSGKFIRLPNRIESKLFLPELECSSSEANCQTRRGCKCVTVVHQVVGYYVTREGVCKLWDSLTCRRPTNRSVSGRVQLLYRLCVTTPRTFHD